MTNPMTELERAVVGWLIMWPWLGFWAWTYLRRVRPRETRAWEWPFAMLLAPVYVLAAISVYCQWRR